MCDSIRTPRCSVSPHLNKPRYEGTILRESRLRQCVTVPRRRHVLPLAAQDVDQSLFDGGKIHAGEECAVHRFDVDFAIAYGFGFFKLNIRELRQLDCDSVCVGDDLDRYLPRSLGFSAGEMSEQVMMKARGTNVPETSLIIRLFYGKSRMAF